MLISQNRQNAHDRKRAELDYEVAVRTYRELGEVATLMRTLQARLDALEGAGRTP